MLTLIGVVLLGLFALGVPIAFSMGLAAFTAILVKGDIPMEVVAQRVVTGVDSFPLLAVPFFILGRCPHEHRRRHGPTGPAG